MVRAGSGRIQTEGGARKPPQMHVQTSRLSNCIVMLPERQRGLGTSRVKLHYSLGMMYRCQDRSNAHAAPDKKK